MNVSPTTFQVFGLFHITVSILFFRCVTVKTIYTQKQTRVNKVKEQSNDAILQVTSFTHYMGLKVLKLGKFYNTY